MDAVLGSRQGMVAGTGAWYAGDDMIATFAGMQVMIRYDGYMTRAGSNTPPMTKETTPLTTKLYNVTSIGKTVEAQRDASADGPVSSSWCCHQWQKEVFFPLIH